HAGETPAAYPPAYTGPALPTAYPPAYTPSPTTTPYPPGYTGDAPTASPYTCVSGWSKWISADTPDTGDGDHELLTDQAKQGLCPGGELKQIECQTVNNIPYHSSGEIVTCSVDQGLVCNNADNSPIPCSDYQVRYLCECAGVPTAYLPGYTGPTPTAFPAGYTGSNPGFQGAGGSVGGSSRSGGGGSGGGGGNGAAIGGAVGGLLLLLLAVLLVAFFVRRSRKKQAKVALSEDEEQPEEETKEQTTPAESDQEKTTDETSSNPSHPNGGQELTAVG
ncbi:hypothetical protein BaRGS_00007474, partial [Batillaria attramentaria]